MQAETTDVYQVALALAIAAVGQSPVTARSRWLAQSLRARL